MLVTEEKTQEAAKRRRNLIEEVNLDIQDVYPHVEHKPISFFKKLKLKFATFFNYLLKIGPNNVKS